VNSLKRNKSWKALILLIPIMILLSGCVYLIVGGIGALGGYVVSPDTVEGISGQDAITVWDAAVEIVSVMGIIEEQNEEGGIIIAKINGAKTTITITSISDSAVKLNIKARKHFLPKITVAQEVFVKIMSYLSE